MADSSTQLIPDRSLDNADWLRALRWDITVPTATGQKIVRTVADMLVALDVSEKPKEEQQAAVQHFMTLPAARAMPAKLRQALDKAGLLDVPATQKLIDEARRIVYAADAIDKCDAAGARLGEIIAELGDDEESIVAVRGYAEMLIMTKLALQEGQE